MANVNAPVARFEKLIINPIRRLLSPNAKAVVPPRNPLFSTVVLSPKYARHEGKPNPSEKPEKRKTNKIFVVLWVSNVTNNKEAITPRAIHIDRNKSRLETFFTRIVPNIEKVIAAAV